MRLIASLLLFLPLFINAFHFYVDANVNKCFREDLMKNTAIVGGFKALVFDSSKSSFYEDKATQIKVVVSLEAGNGHNLVDTTGSFKGKFHFTAAETGIHLICLTVQGQGWFTTRAKVFLDIQFGDDSLPEAVDHTSVITEVKYRVSELVHRVEGIRTELKSQREREGELREMSEVINSHTYRFTLVQVFVLVLTCAWQLRHLKQFFMTKKLV